VQTKQGRIEDKINIDKREKKKSCFAKQTCFLCLETSEKKIAAAKIEITFTELDFLMC
jgi:hypothetical protein